MYLVVDVETSDLLKRDVSLADPSQPWAVSIAALLCEPDGTDRDFFATRIRADGRQIRADAQNVHGITSREAGRNGVSELTALGMLIGLAANATYCIGHGIDFDRQVIESLLIRRDKATKMWTRPGLVFVDTMLAGVPVCRIPSGRDDNQFKWPSLDELLATLNLPPRPQPHTAWGDVQATKAAFFALRASNVLEVAA